MTIVQQTSSNYYIYTCVVHLNGLARALEKPHESFSLRERECTMKFIDVLENGDSITEGIYFCRKAQEHNDVYRFSFIDNDCL